MTEIYLLGPVILFLLVSIIEGYSKYKLKNPSLLEIEKGLTPLHTTICTVRLDGKGYAFTRLAFYNDFIVINNQKNIVLQFGDISGITQGKPFFGSSKLDIEHKNKNIPSVSLQLKLKDIDIPKSIITSKIEKNIV